MNRFFRNLDDFEVISPEVIGATLEDDIIFTKKAMEKIVVFLDELKKDTEEKYFIRLTAKHSKNHSKRFSILVEDEITENDKVFELHKVTIVIDAKSIFYFMGVIIDYVDQGNKGFVFIDNFDENTVLPSEMSEGGTNFE
ncbi:MAG: hypothetical protein GX372_02590 [Ignavibacteria bacterium]|jgi:Fe-S cluster assembly iron-binding protein IscA|nr:hypothetical protein [Ignavibacteria bacterium]